MLRCGLRPSWNHLRQARLIAYAGLSTQPALHRILAIESSCDDTSVAVLDVDDTGRISSDVKFHKTMTARSEQYRGIHPEVALRSHIANTAKLAQEACTHLRMAGQSWQPTLVAATRGPGMRSNLAVGLHVAKGLAVAWDVSLIGVHHMQAHALTPRLVSSMQADGPVKPEFPYLSILVSGGHTMLLQSTGLTEHKILAETCDVALGNYIDKAARAILPDEQFTPPYGAALERFAFPNGETDYQYVAPRHRGEELAARETPFHWRLKPPFSVSAGDKSSRRMAFSFAGIGSQVVQVMYPEQHVATTGVHRSTADISTEERRCMAREAMRLGFEHVASRVLLYLSQPDIDKVTSIVVSGGVASNKYLRHVMRAMLDARGHSDIELLFPPPALCTDNALMIAWAAYEMYSNGHTSSLDINPIRHWSMDSTAEDGGILGTSETPFYIT